MARNVTVADIAREAGVSMMTVSRVINHAGGVGAATRQRIQLLIDQRNYRPSGIARSLATQHTGTIGLMIPDVSNPFFADVARGAEHLAYAQGYNLLLCNTEEDPQRELAVVRSLEEKRVDGVVLFSRLTPLPLSRMLQHVPAAVLINRQLPARARQPASVGTVRLDDVTGGCLVTDHLLTRGHRAIGFLAGPSASYSGRARAKGYQQALAVSSPNPHWKRHCAPTVEGGLAAAHELLRAEPELTALFCYNDLVAVGALQACAAELGRRVPQDVAVAGYDDIPLAALVTPSLTTCRAPRYELGTQAVRLLLDRIQGCVKGCEDVVLQPELVIRASAP